MAKRSRATFAFQVGDSIQVVSDEDVYADDHPFVKARPEMFRDVSEDPVIHKPVLAVEQATAAPGEKRNR